MMTTLTVPQIEQLWINAGGDPSAAPLMAAIAIAESSGRTDALNNNSDTKDFSVGLWQINYYGNLLSSRTASFGSPQDLMSSPEAQAKAAVALYAGGAGIGNWKGDAAYKAWANGQSLEKFGVTGPLSGGTLATAAAAASSLPDTPDSDIDGFLKSQAPQLAKVLASDPQVVSLLQQWGAPNGLSDQEFRNELEQTDWWKNTPATQRQNLIQQATDPATAKQTLDQTVNQVNTLAAQMGVGISPQDAQSIATQVINGNWTNSQLSQKLSTYAKYSGGSQQIKGQAGVTIQQLKNLYASYALPVSDATLQDKMQQVLSGKLGTGQQAIDSFSQQLSEQAKSLYGNNPDLASALDRGETTAQFMQPYADYASQILGKQQDINWLDPKWNVALTGTVDASGRTAPMSLAQWGTKLRSDPTYGYDSSPNAIQTASQFATQLTQALTGASI